MNPIPLKFVPKELLKAAIGNSELTADILMALCTDLASSIVALTMTPESNDEILEESIKGVRALNAEIKERFYAEYQALIRKGAH